ncbi:ERF family protein [Aquisalinus luteolus]|uniref:ERF family protein n=1 Tax=Aquisalinus luteolus TaxID=1566827 RepID=A0A8J3A5T5_9PROT|nr:ERF family protein [Aquisalinus luteolus]GGI00134.1 hypothetical protein GCM10011355_27710 [Aquisalinus luteolus]
MSEQKNQVIDIPRRDNSPAVVTPMELISRAMENGAGMEQLEKLMELQERWEKGQARKSFDAAMAAARSEIKPIMKGREVDFTTAKGRTHYKYEDIALIAEQVDPILAEHGLSYRWRTDVSSGNINVTCIVAHRDGYSEETTLPGQPDNSGNKNNIQAMGSTVTYLQRYTLKAALGLAAAPDTDGHAPQQQQKQYDATGWFVDIETAKDRAALDAIGDRLKDEWQGIPNGPLMQIKKAWNERKREMESTDGTEN